jgi:MFS family permease
MLIVLSFIVGNSYQSQMPGFADALGHGNPGTLYSLLLAADAGGALFAGILLESRGLLKPHPRTALLLAMAWCATLFTFAINGYYIFAILLLFLCGFFELSFNSMAQSIVQTNAPTEIRGRVIGLFNMTSMGLRIGSGLTVGVVGGWIGIHYALAMATFALMAIILFLLYRHQLLGSPSSCKIRNYC